MSFVFEKVIDYPIYAGNTRNLQDTRYNAFLIYSKISIITTKSMRLSDSDIQLGYWIPVNYMR